MRPTPPAQLITLLRRLGLPAAERIGRVAGRVARSAKDLPVFESVWIDALMQARYLTPFQAAEIRDGRGPTLRRGNYLIEAPLATDGLVCWFRGRSIARRRTVRIATFSVEASHAATVTTELKSLIATLGSITPPLPSRPIAFGAERTKTDDANELTNETPTDEHRRIWLAENDRQGTTARRWMTQCGRFPAETVVAIARITAEQLASIHAADIVHGDLSAGNLLLTPRGEVSLTGTGLRPILRPEEGFARDDLPPVCYDYLAPEQIGDGAKASRATDIFALGCLWWHLLCGRPPRSGGTAEDKIRAVRYDEVPDPRRLIPHVPDMLRDAIRQATDPDSERRPQSVDVLLDWLGPPTRRDRRLVARAVRSPRPNLTDGWTKQYAGSDTPSVPSTTAAPRSRRPLRSILGLSILLTVISLAAINFAAPETFHLAAALFDRFDAPADPRPAEPSPPDPPAPLVVDSPPSVPPLEQPAEPAVVPASAIEPIADTGTDLILDANGPVVVDRLQLQPGQIVRAPVGRRATLIVPSAGLPVDVEDVRFEGIDFVAAEDAAADTIIRLTADQVRFTGCTFRAPSGAAYPPVAIRWIATPQVGLALLPSGRLTMIDCQLGQVSSAVEIDAPGDRGLHFRRVTHSGFGPLVRVGRPLDAESTLSLHLNESRLDESGPLLQVRTDANSSGRVLIRTEACRLDCRSDVALLELTGQTDPTALLAQLRWLGKETTIPLDATVATWQDEALDDATIAIEGVMRTDEDRELGSKGVRE